MEIIKKCVALGLLVRLIAAEVIELNRDNWNLLIDGEWMVEIYASCSYACKNFESIWNDFSTHSSELSIKVARIDICQNQRLLAKLWITDLPSILHISKGDFREYTGPRNMRDIISFIKDKSLISRKNIIATMNAGSDQDKLNVHSITEPFAEIVFIGTTLGLFLTMIMNIDLRINTPKLGKDWGMIRIVSKKNKNKKRRHARRKKTNNINAQNFQ